METIQTLMVMLHWKSIFNFITMKLTFTSLFYTCFIFGLVSRLFYFLLFSFFFSVATFFFVQDAAYAAFFIGRKRFICTTWWEWLYRIMNSSLVLGLYYHIFVSWIDSFLRYDFYLQLGLTSSRNKVVSQKGCVYLFDLSVQSPAMNYVVVRKNYRNFKILAPLIYHF